MKKMIFSGLLLWLIGLLSSVGFANLTGAGATFPYPIYAKWADAYQQKTGIRINYQPIGSGGGIKQIQAKLVDFGASDKPLSSQELKEAGLIQFPTLIGGITPIFNLPELKKYSLQLSGEVLADIYLGKIKKWNDPNIKALNPNLPLPEKNITVVHRSDGSGTTFLFTNYLSKVSSEWQRQVGSDTAISWPSGIGGKGNEGVASYVQRIPGAIGYVEYAYAKQNHFSIANMMNKAGKKVSPSIASFQAAATHANWQAKNHFADILTNTPGSDSWPISGATYILIHATPDKPAQTKAVLDFFTWAYKNGGEMATALDYVPLPQAVVASIESYWHDSVKN